MKHCPKHPKYTGNKPPKYQCVGCASLYLKLGKGVRKPIPKPGHAHKDEKTYNRKTKHKKDWL